VVTVAQQCVLDTLGVTLAARDEPVLAALHAGWGDELSGGRSTLIDGTGRLVSAGSAALVNGTAAHALDFDDVHPAMIGHPSAPLVPAALALGEELDASGADVITALVAGYEVQCRIGAAIVPSHYLRGFHPTGTAATFGVAAAAGRLLGLDSLQMQAALGIAGTQAAGLKAMFGTMCKPLHSGKAAVNGILSAKLAAAGFDTAPDVLGSPQGFLAAQSDGFDAAFLGTEFGEPWHTLGIVFKLHAACGYTHAAIEAMLAARDTVASEDVDRVDLLVHPELLTAANIEEPTTPLEAKFSVRFVTAMALARGSVGAGDFTPRHLSDGEVRRISRRVQVAADESGRVGRLGTIATVRTHDGLELTFERDSSTVPWTQDPAEQWDRLRSKFEGLAAPILGDRGTELADRAGQLSVSPKIRSLLQGTAA
jgi:2-methylcitrate dehydratase PrpD